MSNTNHRHSHKVADTSTYFNTHISSNLLGFSISNSCQPANTFPYLWFHFVKKKCRCLLWWNRVYVKCKWEWVLCCLGMCARVHVHVCVCALLSNARTREVYIIFTDKFNGNMDILIIHEIWLLLVMHSMHSRLTYTLHGHIQAHIYNSTDFFGSNKVYAYINKGVFLMTMWEVSYERFLPVFICVGIVVAVVAFAAAANNLLGFFLIFRYCRVALWHYHCRCHNGCHWNSLLNSLFLTTHSSFTSNWLYE